MTNLPKMICFDMDGTIADLYAVPDWLSMLRAENPNPYYLANPMCDMSRLFNALTALHALGVEIRVITWLSKDSTEDYKNAVRDAKRTWLACWGFPYDHFHGVQYGATKADCIRRYLSEDETAILFDDSEKVRKGWHMGEALNPAEINIVEYLENLLN